MNRNFSNAGLIPPIAASDGFTSQPEPEKRLAEILAEEASSVRSAAFQDVLTYSVDSALNGGNHNLRTIVNVRHNLPWKIIDQIIERATPFIKPAIEKALAERDALETQRIRFENLAGLFTALGLQIQPSNDGYNLIGLTEQQLRLCAGILSADE